MKHKMLCTFSKEALCSEHNWSLGCKVEAVIEMSGQVALTWSGPFNLSFSRGEMRSRRGNHSTLFSVAVRSFLEYPSRSFGIQTPGRRVSNTYQRESCCYEGSHSRERVCVFLNACLSLLIRSAHIGKLTMKY